MIHRPSLSDAPPYCFPFFELVDGNDLLLALEESRFSTMKLMAAVPKELENHAYATGKWSVKEVFWHIIECERIYSYRALRFSRQDPTELPGFEEGDYIVKGRTMNYGMAELMEEYVLVRSATIALFRPMTEAMLDFRGKANGVFITPRSLGYMAVGHNLHHCNVVRDHYL